MLTKKQRWRRVRVLRSNSGGSLNSGGSFSSTDSGSSGSGGGGDRDGDRDGDGDRDTREGIFPASATGRSSMAENATTAVPEDATDGTAPTPPPPPLPPPQQRAPPALPHEAAASGVDPNNASLEMDARTGAEPGSASPSPAEGQPQQRQQQHQHPNNICGAGDGNLVPNHRHPLDAWRISALNLLKFIFFFDNGGGGHDDGRPHHHHGRGFGGANRDRAATEGCHPLTAVSSARPRRPSEPSPLPSRSRVRFSHQIRVILVASRVEMSSVKADVWWGEKDYCDFRRAYLTAAREKKAVDGDSELSRMPDGGGACMPGQQGERKNGMVLPRPEPPVCSISSSSAPAPATASSSSSSVGDGGEDAGKPRPSRAQDVPSPPPPPPSPEGTTRPCRAGDEAGVEERGQNPRGSEADVAAGSGAVLGLDKLEPKSEGAPTARPMVGEAAAATAAELSMPPAGSAAAEMPALPERESSPAPDAEGGKNARAAAVLAAPVPTAPCAASAAALGGFEPARNKDPSVDVAVVARGFPWRAAGTRTRAEAVAVAAAEAAARRSPGSSVVAAARAASRARGARGGVGGDGAGGGGNKWKRPRDEPTAVVLEVGRGRLRIDPRTGLRVPLPFLGEAPIRRVASF
eukprot:g16024.t1